MDEAVSRSGRRPTPSRGSMVATGLALVAAVVYWVLFSPGWEFLLAAGVVIGLLYVLMPYVRASLRS